MGNKNRKLDSETKGIKERDATGKRAGGRNEIRITDSNEVSMQGLAGGENSQNLPEVIELPAATTVSELVEALRRVETKRLALVDSLVIRDFKSLAVEMEQAIIPRLEQVANDLTLIRSALGLSVRETEGDPVSRFEQLYQENRLLKEVRLTTETELQETQSALEGHIAELQAVYMSKRWRLFAWLDRARLHFQRG